MQRKAAGTAHPRSKAATRTYGGECVFAPAVKSRSQGTGVHNLGDAAAWHVHHGCGDVILLTVTEIFVFIFSFICQ